MAFAPDAILVERVNADSKRWRQGDVLHLGAMAWFASPATPLTAETAEAAGDKLSCIVGEAEQVVVLSQTCDVVRDSAVRPYVLLARLVRLDEPVAGEARKGSRPRFVPVPGLGDDAFADLDVVVSMEKALILDISPTRGLPDERAQRRFAAGVARVFSRFAFPDDLAVALRGVVARVRDKHAKNSSEGKALAALEEIRVTGTPSWDSSEIDVFVTFAPPTRDEAAEVMPEDEWDSVVDAWLRRAEPFGVIQSIDGAMIPLDELTAREYLDSDPLDLDYLSWQRSA